MTTFSFEKSCKVVNKEKDINGNKDEYNDQSGSNDTTKLRKNITNVEISQNGLRFLETNSEIN